MNNSVQPSLLASPIESLQLSMAALGFLKRSQINTIADLLVYTQEDLKILDPTCADEVIVALQQRSQITLPLESTDEEAFIA
jgi:DNA-directed RNA polymerase alpha subunit